MRDVRRLGCGKLLGSLAAMVILFAYCSNAWAVVLAYEGFDYAAGTQVPGDAMNGGTGWAGAWDESQAASFSTAVQATSLAYTDDLGNTLVTTGGKLLTTGVDGTSQPGRTLSARRASPESGATVTTWLSFVGQRIGDLTMDPASAHDGTYQRGANLALFDLNSGATNTEKLDMGENSNVRFPSEGGGFEDRWQTRGFVNAAVTFEQPYPQNPEGTSTQGQARDAYSEVKFGDQAFFVMRIDHLAGETNASTVMNPIGGTGLGGNDNIFIWLNPDLNSTPVDANASIEYVSADIVTRANELGVVPYQNEPAPGGTGGGGETSFDRLRLFAGNVSGTAPFAQWLFDELRVGETFADVAPFVPPVGGVPGDYNDSGDVDAADYVVWREAQIAGATTLTNRGSGINGAVGQADYDFWKGEFGNPPGAGAGSAIGGAAIPEPAMWLLGALAFVAWSNVRCRRRAA